MNTIDINISDNDFIANENEQLTKQVELHKEDYDQAYKIFREEIAPKLNSQKRMEIDMAFNRVATFIEEQRIKAKGELSESEREEVRGQWNNIQATLNKIMSQYIE